MGVYTGSVPTFLASELPDSDKFDEITDFMTAATSAWTTWTPTLTNLTLGSGSSMGRYRQLGKTVDFRWKFIFGSGSAITGLPRFSLPVAPHANYIVTVDLLGVGTLGDTGNNSYWALARLGSGSTGEIVGIGTSSQHIAVSSTVPFTWGSGDSMSVSGTYEAA
jgi:hypothetical protein